MVRSAAAADFGGTVGCGSVIGGAVDFGGPLAEADPSAASVSALRFFVPGLPCPALFAAMRASSGGGAVSG